MEIGNLSKTVSQKKTEFWRKGGFLWTVAVLVSLAAAQIEMQTGATHPLRRVVEIADSTFRVKLPRLHSGSSGAKVAIPDPGGINAKLLWREADSGGDFVRVPMTSEGETLMALFPSRNPPDKLEYRLELEGAGDTIIVPEGRLVTLSFTGGVPAWLLVPHILFMFLTTLFAARCALELLNPARDLKKFTRLTLGALIIGGFVIGIPAEYYAIGKWWTGFPLGNSVTDNKTLVVLAFWVTALVALERGGDSPSATSRWLSVLAASATFVLFLLPGDICG